MKNFSTLFSYSILISIILLTSKIDNKLSAQNYVVKMWEHTQGLPDTVDWSASVRDDYGSSVVRIENLAYGV